MMEKGLCSQTETAVHCHDLIAFKRCRRKWFWSSPFGLHLEKKGEVIYVDGAPIGSDVNPHLWFGSGFHFAMEDLEGWKRFSNGTEAFNAYVDAHPIEKRPENWEELQVLGGEMVRIYEQYREKHGTQWEVVQLDGVPLVEARYSLVLDEVSFYEYEDGTRYFPTDSTATLYSAEGESTVCSREAMDEDAAYNACERRQIVAHGTFDAIVQDEHGGWWILDYKTAKAFDDQKLDLDQQISMYCWAAAQWFNHPIEGMVYVQVHKSPPKAPKVTKTGVSTDARQRTTYELYRDTCIEQYGEDIPAKQQEFLDGLACAGLSKFIQVNWVARNEHHQVMTYNHIIAQTKEILNPKLALYPNPTKDCSWDCPFIQVCKATEEGADAQYLLDSMYKPRNETLTDDLPEYIVNLATKYPEKFPEEWKTVQEMQEAAKPAVVDSVDDFLKKYE